MVVEFAKVKAGLILLGFPRKEGLLICCCCCRCRYDEFDLVLALTTNLPDPGET